MFDTISQWARQSPADYFWLVTSLLIAAALAAFITAFIFFYRKRLVEDIPTSKVRSAAQGYVELSGRGQLLEGPPIVAPLTGITCTWYSYNIQEKRQSGKNSRWVTVRKGQSDELFLLVDSTGQCVIDPEGAKVTPSIKQTWYGNSLTPTKPHQSDSNINALMTTMKLGFGRYRYTEHRMHPNEQLYAIGLFRSEGGAGGNLDVNEDVRELLREWKQDTQALLTKYDKNKDGQLDMEEWQAAREDAYRQVLAKHAEEKVTLPTQMMSKTNDHRKPYLLSAKPQSEMVRHYAYYSMVLLSGFFIFSALVAWFINLRMG